MTIAEHQVLTFDVVGTCIDFETGIFECVSQLTSASLDRDTVLDAFAQAEDEQQQKTPEVPFTQMLEHIYVTLATEFGLPAGPSGRDALRLSIPHWPAFADSSDALAQLRRSFMLVALTNADVWAANQMAATLNQPFDDIVTAEDVGVNKPSPRVFDYCRGRLSADGYGLDDILHVAQSQYHDIGVAKKLGYQVCWIERRSEAGGYGATPNPGTKTTPDYHFSSLTGLADAIE